MLASLLTIVGVLLIAGYYFVLRSREERPRAVEIPAVAISVGDAKVQVDRLVASGRHFVTDVSDQLASETAPSPLTKEFFKKFGSVTAVGGGFKVAPSEIRESDRVQNGVSIGHSEDWDIVQLIGNDMVFVVEGGPAVDLSAAASYPSVYHLIIDEAR